MMTTAAAVLGALPLAIGIGQGASLRQPLGITVMGGLILSQVFTLYTTPGLSYLDRLPVRLAQVDGGVVVAQRCERERMSTGRAKRCLVGVLGAVLGGCLVGPNYHRPPAPAAPQ